ncbi:MAG: phosphoglycerate dehydrogenase and related [Desulfovibrionaceae bacterium]|nr:MAG: phosphoglycerate dehydrogenase and related [Desulfovibrionaceae bacterium]
MKNKARIAVASRSFSRHPVLRRELLERYENVTFNDQGASLSGESLIAFLRGHEKAVTALERLDKGLFAALPELRVISKYGVGLDMIDLPAMEASGVALGWTGGVNRRSVAELTIAAAVALLHKTPQACRAVQAGGWRQIMGRELSSSTVGIVGCGHIGKEVARLLRAFGCRVLAHDILDFPEFYAANTVSPMALEEMLPLADVVTLHLPLDDSTLNILDARRLELMKTGACLINYARGGLADEAALKRMLLDGRLSGAALDVFRDEPPTDMELVHLPNVLVTPHIGGSTEEAVLAMGRAAIAGLDAALPPSRHEF